MWHTLTTLGGYRMCGLDVFLAAGGDVDAAHELGRAAQAARHLQRDQQLAAERAQAKTAPATPASTTPKPMTVDNYESLRDYGDQDETENLYTPPSQYCEDRPNGTDKPCWACGEARTNYKDELADWKEWRRDVFKERAAIRLCDLCDKQRWWIVDGNHVHMFKDGPKGAIRLTVQCNHDEKKNQDYVQARLDQGWYFAPPEQVAGLIAAAEDQLNKTLDEAFGSSPVLGAVSGL
jgi:hypothetical protein